MFANGVGTVLTYYDASGAISYWGPSNNPPMGYSMGTINNSPAAFVPTQGAYSIAGTSGTASSTPSWQYTVSASGLQQTTNGTQKLNVDSNGDVSTPGSVEASRFVGAVTTVAFSETPVFDLSQGDQAITLSGDVSASEAINIAQGQAVTFRVCQDSVGGRSFKWPLNFQAATAVSQNASACTIQKFESFDGTTLSSVGGASMILP
jgi:hypothetical protein